MKLLITAKTNYQVVLLSTKPRIDLLAYIVEGHVMWDLNQEREVHQLVQFLKEEEENQIVSIFF